MKEHKGFPNIITKLVNISFIVMSIILLVMYYKDVNSEFIFKFLVFYLIYFIFVVIYDVLNVIKTVRGLDN